MRYDNLLHCVRLSYFLSVALIQINAPYFGSWKKRSKTLYLFYWFWHPLKSKVAIHLNICYTLVPLCMTYINFYNVEEFWKRIEQPLLFHLCLSWQIFLLVSQIVLLPTCEVWFTFNFNSVFFFVQLLFWVSIFFELMRFSNQEHMKQIFLIYLKSMIYHKFLFLCNSIEKYSINRFIFRKIIQKLWQKTIFIMIKILIFKTYFSHTHVAHYKIQSFETQ